MLSKRSQMKEPIVGFHFYRILESANRSAQKQRVGAWGGGWGSEKGGSQVDTRNDWAQQIRSLSSLG